MFYFGNSQLTPSAVLAIARKELDFSIHAQSIERIKASSKIVQEIGEGEEPVYGINTGFGFFCKTKIAASKIDILQEKLLKSHAIGVGDHVAPLIVRMMLVLKIHSLCLGYSGVTLELIEQLMFWLKNDITPVVPEQGSLGASGDLAPLAHLFLPLLHLGYVFEGDAVVPAKKVLEKMSVPIYQLKPKEGLALINGTQFIAAHAVKVLDNFHRCLSHADIIGGMMVDGMLGSASPFLNELHAIRPYKGTSHVAHHLHHLLKGSKILESHANCAKVQDPYSLRCMPQVHGASRETWNHFRDLVTTEINSVTDNPIIISKDKVISGGNFHGQPLAMAIDYACIAMSEIGNISDRRIYLSLEGKTEGTPMMLVDNPGLNSGFMILQYTTAALVNENKSFCYPSSVDSIPTCLGQEDHVSMGATSARRALRISKNVETILALELLVACQALDYRHPIKSSETLEKIHQFVRQQIPHTSEDVIISEYIKIALSIIQSNTLSHIANQNTAYYESPFREFFEVY